jgi:hyperosmotically inducible periplasmic protein
MHLGTKRCIAVCIMGLVVGVPPAFGQQSAAPSDAQQQQTMKIAEAVRKAIVNNTQYGVFDNIHFAIQGSTVILRGEASRPTLKSGVEGSVKRIPGVTSVQNEIDVLPIGQNDDRIRAQVYRAIYGPGSPLQRYTSNRGAAARLDQNSVARRAGGITNDPPLGWHAIHIIVKNGNVTLTGVVDNSGDFTIAGMRANQVPGVFSVDNDLQIAGKQNS